MTATDLLTELEGFGCTIQLKGWDTIGVIPPTGFSLTDEQRKAIRDNKPELLKILRQREMKQIEQMLNETGWVAIHSDVLDEDILWCRDAKVAVPARWKDAVRYTLAELKKLTSLSLSDEGLKRVHHAKKLFNGRVLGNERRR